ncbi:MAG: ATPase [Pseudonocardiaceae bacterium]|nr:ATPase [Pseudonocardiaceae bacterium]
MTEPAFVYTTHIATTPDALWRALTSSEFTEQYWSGSSIESDWQVGSAIVERHPDREGFHGEVLRAEPPQVLSYTFQTGENEAAGNPPTRVSFDIRPFGEVVTLTVTHDELPGGEFGARFVRDIGQGWPGILSSLKTLLESGEPLNFPPPFAPKRPISA